MLKHTYMYQLQSDTAVDIRPILTEFSPCPSGLSPSPPHPHTIYYRPHPIPMKLIPIPTSVKKFTSFIQNMYVNKVIVFNTAAVL